MSHFVGWHAALCSLQHFSLRQNKGVNGKQEHKCIRMGLTIFKIVHLGRYIFVYMAGNQVLWLRSCFAIKLNF